MGCPGQRARPLQATLHSFRPGVCGRGSGTLSPSPWRVWGFGRPLRPSVGRRPGCRLRGRLLLLWRTPRGGLYFQQDQSKVGAFSRGQRSGTECGLGRCSALWGSIFQRARARAGLPKPQSRPTPGLPRQPETVHGVLAHDLALPEPSLPPHPSRARHGSRSATVRTRHSLPVYLRITT